MKRIRRDTFRKNCPLWYVKKNYSFRIWPESEVCPEDKFDWDICS